MSNSRYLHKKNRTESDKGKFLLRKKATAFAVACNQKCYVAFLYFFCKNLGISKAFSSTVLLISAGLLIPEIGRSGVV